jgi:hypothetical protein
MNDVVEAGDPLASASVPASRSTPTTAPVIPTCLAGSIATPPTPEPISRTLARTDACITEQAFGEWLEDSGLPDQALMLGAGVAQHIASAGGRARHFGETVARLESVCPTTAAAEAVRESLMAPNVAL